MSVTVVGIGAEGWPGLGEPARAALEKADVVLGAPRQLALLPDLAAEHVTWPSPLMPALPGLLAEHADRTLAVLASGDPTFYGIGSAVLAHEPGATVLPAPSSLALACARLGWAAQDVEVLSTVGRPLAAVRAALAPRRRLLVLVPDAGAPAVLAAALTSWGYGEAALTVLASLGAPGESRVDGRAADWDQPAGDPLAVVAVTCPEVPDDVLLGRAPGLPDDAYDHDGQLTKAEVRALSVAALRPVPGALLWDVGGGAGSIAIEWMRHHAACRAVSVEVREDRAARIAANAATLGVPGLRVVVGRAPEALAELDVPDAVFVGGGASAPGMLDAVWTALRPGGRLVVNTVTLEGEAALAAFRADHGGALRRIGIERVAPVGRFSGWRALAGVTQLVARKDV
ncbi:precorrin-6y C5,15-methyltransferase (decarboxylating) subunit CbiE [Actinomycetospora lemnae]|uniref:Precorrin-6y C5,15-methyltransferase (Decarboxylating) subunit CbiE n=1 Tax=Actinomycetospora lemnae TaxID=3019891 RepID=A0ABT5SWK4_9PSEU|nr:precorrin-6y C5,15-methyltransferase (decarboxylating) subunit CbiE [Actinomycetospora sp. DW7H6]MDD7967238.1 precorrin-6y C5,15-methyltransferase (decarboxylating) subunit CbiE [Actinomycetospora sp. DW7H6]